MPFDPQVGDLVCDCRYQHLRIAERDGDFIILEDGRACSLEHCCDAADHEWEHSEFDAEVFEACGMGGHARRLRLVEDP